MLECTVLPHLLPQQIIELLVDGLLLHNSGIGLLYKQVTSFYSLTHSPRMGFIIIVAILLCI